MKDLDLIKQLGDDLAPRGDEPLAGPPVAAFRDSSRKRPLKTWQAGVLALAVAGAIAGASTLRPSPNTPGGQAATPRAATVLDNAAAVSQESTASRLQGAGYIFTETISSYPEQVQQPDGSIKTIRQAPVVTQVWLPVEPTKDGKQRQRPEDGNAAWDPWVMLAGCRETQDSDTLASEFSRCARGVLPASFPTEPAAVLAWLKDDRPGRQDSSPPSAGPIAGQDALAFERARSLLMTGTYLQPDQRSAIFKALAQLPGVVAVANVQDGAGRQGVGISAGGTEALVFHPTSFAFLGTTSSAVMRQGTTTEVGKLPS
ncbi:CU044_5270 family protein [Micromonospora sp. NPDC005172]|uniref:CU044_5270 family protein n=1 Tax=Micromonospora sp. NPDC005172 TaxID=3156867 RepID=UPI0033B6A7A3